MRPLQTTAFAVLFVIGWSAGALAQEQARDFSADSARTHRAGRGDSLTPPSAASRSDIVMDFLRDQGHTNENRDELGA